MKHKGPIPGFGLSLGFTLSYLSAIALLPLGALALKAASAAPGEIRSALLAPRTIAAFKLTFGASLLAATANAVIGLLLAWVLVRYRFPGRRFIDGLIDLPFALPTAVAGITLTSLFARTGWIGGWLEPHGIKVAFTPLGVALALTFIGLPFVVRTVQPVLESLDPEVEQAAWCLGAGRLQTFRRIILPELVPAVGTGFALAFARALGEYGSVAFISGNMPMRTEIVPLLIVTKLEQYDYAGAAAVATAMLVVSLTLLGGIHAFLLHRARKEGMA